MSQEPAADRRAVGGASSVAALRPAPAWVRAGLYRTLAGDDARVAYWVRHVRIGVLVTELAAVAVTGHALLTVDPARDTAALLALAGFVVACTPAVLLLPLQAMMRDWRGPTLCYGWTLTTAVVVITATRLDGGATSPLDALLFLTLTYLAVA